MDKPYIFTCGRCGWTGPSEWSEEDAHAECLEVFGEMPEPEDRITVCEECYQEARRKFPPELWRALANPSLVHVQDFTGLGIAVQAQGVAGEVQLVAKVFAGAVAVHDEADLDARWLIVPAECERDGARLIVLGFFGHDVYYLGNCFLARAANG